MGDREKEGRKDSYIHAYIRDCCTWLTDGLHWRGAGGAGVCVFPVRIHLIPERILLLLLLKRQEDEVATNEQTKQVWRKAFFTNPLLKGKATVGDAACTLLFFCLLFASVVARIVLSRCLFYCVFSEGGVRCFLFLAWKKGLHTAWWYIASFPFSE